MTLLEAGSPPLDMGSHIIVSAEDRRFAIDKSLPSDLVSALIQRAGQEPEVVDDPLLALAQRFSAGETGIDLRQADYARKAELPIDLKRFRLLVGLAVVCALAWGAYTIASIRAMNQLEAVLDRQTRASFAAMYPTLKNAIETGGLSVRLGDARVEDGRVVGDLILEQAS